MNLFELLINNWELVISFFFVALIYSSVGFGGGSSYLAILALTALSYEEIRAIALFCNLVVVSNSFYLYYKKGLYTLKKVLPLVITSVPMAFIGGFLKIEESLFYLLLGITLLIASIVMLQTKKESINTIDSEKLEHKDYLKNLGYGGAIGFVSGMVGIGGGIFLAPLLHITRWDTSKKIAATASLFILVNSISGLAGQLLNPSFNLNYQLTFLLITTAFLGGQIGTRLSIQLISPSLLKRSTALLIGFVAIKLLYKYI